MLLRQFQRQAALQCKYVIFSASQLNEGLRINKIDLVFYALQNLLNAGANISKILWGGGGKKFEERKFIRDSIGISDNSPLRQVVMRNNFEHLDERLDRWWETSKRHNHADMNIGPKGRMIAGLDDIDMFRFFDPETTDLTFWGQEFNIQALVSEAEKILPRLEAEANKPHWNC